jgi:hypothetical protein
MEYRAVSEMETDEAARTEAAAIRWLAQRLCFEAWLDRVRTPSPEPDRRIAAAA